MSRLLEFRITELSNIVTYYLVFKISYLFVAGFEHTMSEGGLPLQLAAAVFLEVEAVEQCLIRHHLHGQVDLHERVVGPVAHREDVYCQVYVRHAAALVSQVLQQKSKAE